MILARTIQNSLVARHRRASRKSTPSLRATTKLSNDNLKEILSKNNCFSHSGSVIVSTLQFSDLFIFRSAAGGWGVGSPQPNLPTPLEQNLTVNESN